MMQAVVVGHQRWKGKLEEQIDNERLSEVHQTRGVDQYIKDNQKNDFKRVRGRDSSCNLINSYSCKLIRFGEHNLSKVLS